MFSEMNQNANDMKKPEDKDTFGGSVKDTGIYPAEIDLAFIKKADSGALMFNITFLLEDKSKFSISECIQSGDAKGNKPYYIDKKSQEKVALPGFTTISTITELLLGKSLDQFTDADVETKTINLYSAQHSKEIPQDVPFVTALKGLKVNLGLLKVVTNKQVKQGTSYVDTNEKREINELNKLFDAGGFTLSERKAQLEEPNWINEWKTKFGNETVDRFKEVKSSPSAMKPQNQASGMFASKGGEQQATNQGSSLFAQNNQNQESE